MITLATATNGLRDLNNSTKSCFNFESLLSLVNASNQGKFSNAISNVITELYQIIRTDIHTPESEMGGRFFYSEINCRHRCQIYYRYYMKMMRISQQVK